ncbi:MAG TPA: porin family protein, partial [Saprospiraceae bacterium]|nr:porin family protein [Saprospiraceae bacterium]
MACMFIALTSQAQGKLGLRAGILISKQDFKKGMLNVDPKSKFGADLALLCEFGIGDVIAISPEFHWLQKGAKIKDLNAPFNESSRTFNYFELPVLLKFKFGEGAGFFLFAGPSIGYLFDATDKDNDGSNTDINLSDYKRAELGAHLGGGIKLGPLNVDVRYILGFSNIADYNGSDLQIKNSGFGAGVSFIF